MLNLIQKGLKNIQSDGIVKTSQKASHRLLLPRLLSATHEITDLKLERRNDLLLFGGSEYGRGNSKYVFEWICNNYPKFSPIWVTDNDRVYSELKSKDLPVCKYLSPKHVYYLHRAGVGLISNSLRDIVPSADALPDSMVIFFLDHGSPVKFGQVMKSESGKRKRNNIDYWITLSKFHTTHRIQYPEANQPTYLTTGFPRNDVLFESSQDLLSSSFRLAEGYTTMLYAPTKRKSSRWGQPVQLFPFDDFDHNRLFSFLRDHNIQLLINLHPTSMQQLSNPNLQEWSKSLRNRLRRLTSCSHIQLTSEETIVRANELMSISDILITDYSSMYHDYLLLDRPILFFPYDYNEFRRNLGFSYNYYKHLPGPDIRSFEEFLSYSRKILDEEDPHRYDRKRLQRRMHANIDSNSTKRVVESIKAVCRGDPVNTVDGVTAIRL